MPWIKPGAGIPAAIKEQRTKATVSGVAAGWSMVQVVAPGDGFLVTGVKARSPLGSLLTTATVYLVDAAPALALPDDLDVLYQSASTTFTASATTADIADSFTDQARPSTTGVWALVNAAAGGAWSLELLVTGMVS